jgi:hypothetical protein
MYMRESDWNGLLDWTTGLTFDLKLFLEIWNFAYQRDNNVIVHSYWCQVEATSLYHALFRVR